MKFFNQKRKAIVLFLALILLMSQVVYADMPIIKRPDAPDAYKWDLTQIYPTATAFEQEIADIKTGMTQFESMKGTLNSTEGLRKYFDLSETLGRKMAKATVYAFFNYSLNQADSNAQEMNALADSTSNALSSAKSFAAPEILQLSEAQIQTFAEDPTLSDVQFYLFTLLKKKGHTLSDKEEALLSSVSDIAGTTESIYDMATVADYQKPVIKNSSGEDLVVSRSLFSRLLDDPDRANRKTAYDAVFESYKHINNTLGANYIGEIKKNIFFAKSRKYKNALESSMAAENIPQDIYNNLITSVNNNLSYLHRYFEIKKKYLGVEELHFYDSYRSLVNDYSMEMSFDDGNVLIMDALKPLGEDYINTYGTAITDRWMDVYEDSNKDTGAYQWSSYDTHPYVLLNYDNSLDSVLTVAHEMGHAMNSYYSDKNQPYEVADYPIFTAEVASTMNELLVMDKLIKNAKDDNEKLFLINTQIENIKGTVFQQVMYAEFENEAHKLVESGQPVSADSFNKLWETTVKKYYGPAFTSDEYLQYGWTRIPHFYYNFYVYKYATSMSAAYSLSKEITAGNQQAIDKYMEFLGAGGKDYPVDILKDAGVDMNTSKPVDDILAYFNDLLTEMETLMDKQKK